MVAMPNLSWQGHDLLDTLRSKPVWDRIKTRGFLAAGP
jgi:hypothetical protein